MRPRHPVERRAVSIAKIEKAGIKAPLVAGAHPWGSKADGF